MPFAKHNPPFLLLLVAAGSLALQACVSSSALRAREQGPLIETCALNTARPEDGEWKPRAHCKLKGGTLVIRPIDTLHQKYLAIPAGELEELLEWSRRRTCTQ